MRHLLPILLSLQFSTSLLAQEPIQRIAFGSCAHQIGEQFIWNSIIAQNPQLWIWLGDNIYADTENMDVMRSKYQQLDDNYNYRLLKAKCPIIATWDDHDYGVNDGGKEYPMKKESQRLFLTFFNEPMDSPRWKQQGVYASYDYGPEERQVRVILLDTRYNLKSACIC